MRSNRSTRAYGPRTVVRERRRSFAPAAVSYRLAAGRAQDALTASRGAARIYKRAFDLAVATAGLIVCAPLIVLSALIVMGASPGAPFFAQQRIGLHGRAFRMLKIRTMRPGAETNFAVRDNKSRCDSRVFAFGAFLRRTSLDELPNLWNVLLGEMSIVGPRPMLGDEIELCISRHGPVVSEQRLSVRPGMTGLWQIAGRANLAFDERITLDVRYTQNCSFVGDLVIIAKTFPVVLFGIGAF